VHGEQAQKNGCAPPLTPPPPSPSPLPSLSATSERAAIPALVLAGTFLWLVGESDAARMHAERVLRENEGHEGALVLRGWVEATAGTRVGLGPMGSASSSHHAGAQHLAGTGHPAGPTAADAEASAASGADFDRVLSQQPPAKRDPDACLGLVRHLERAGDYAAAADLLADIAATYPTFVPALTEKARVLVRSGDVDQAQESLSRALALDNNCVEALRLSALLALVYDGPGASSLVRVQDLAAALGKTEPKTAALLASLSRPLARLAGRSRAILAVTLGLVEAATRLDPEDASYPAELGAQRLLAGDVAGAVAAYQEAARVDDGNAEAVTGLMSCQLAQGEVEDAGAQLELFRVVSESLGKSADVALLDAKVAARGRAGDRAAQVRALEEAEELHAAAVRELLGTGPMVGGSEGRGPYPLLPPPTVDPSTFYAAMDPELLMEIAREYVVLPVPVVPAPAAHPSSPGGGPSSSSSSAASVAATAGGAAGGGLLALQPQPDAQDLGSEPVQRALGLLESVTASVPACLPAWLLAAAVRSFCRDWDGALRCITRVLKIDEGYTDAHLLLAHVGLAQGDARMASGALEGALSHSFSIQEQPVFQRMRAKALALKGQTEEAIAVLEAALRIPGVRVNTVGSTAGMTSSSSSSSSSATAAAGSSVRPGRGGIPSSSSSSSSSSAPTGPVRAVPLFERAAIFVLLAECLSATKKTNEAGDVLQDALAEFAGGPMEVNVVVASAQLQVARGDVDAALAQLAAISKDSASYPLALSLKADIYLKHRRDRVRYVRCFEEAAARTRTDRTLAELGDAQMRMGEPEEAIRAYQAALALKPVDAGIARKIGAALVALHDYGRAVQYFSSALAGREAGAQALSSSDRAAIRSDLTELLIKLRRYDDARRMIQEAVAGAGAPSAAGGKRTGSASNSSSAGGAADDVVSLQYARKNLVLLARVQRASKDDATALETLRQALDVQGRLLGLLRRGGGGGGGGGGGADGAGAAGAALLVGEREQAAVLAVEAGKVAEECLPPQDDVARSLYGDALKHVDGWEPALLSLARLHIRKGDYEAARGACGAVLDARADCDEAAMLLADLEFTQDETAAAMYHYEQLLERRPSDYKVHLKLAALLKRTGRAADIPRLLRIATRANPAAEADAGYKLVKGVHHRYMNQPAEAIATLNAIRTTQDWGALATEHMVLIYLSPDGDPLWLERGDAATNSSGAAAAVPSARAGAAASAGASGAASGAGEFDAVENTRIAARLLEDLPAAFRGPKHDALACSVLIASRSFHKGALDEALGRLGTTLERDPDNVPALLALATAFMVSKQIPKARNQLKRMLKLPFDSALADEFVLGWMMLADVYADGGKLDQAQEALQRAIALDASCGRAFEFLGGIAEKELRYAEAAECYEKVSGRLGEGEGVGEGEAK
jgi:tetratricopeptide repeat protein 21B